MQRHALQRETLAAPGGRLYDRLYDLSLRLLMMAITAVLIGCVGLLAWRWLHPPQRDGGLVPVSEVTPKSTPSAPLQTTSVASEQVLHAPGQVFRCDVNGRITFTDRPCTTVAR